MGGERDGGVREGVAEAHTGVGQVVQDRRQVPWMAVAAEVIGGSYPW